MTYYLSRLQYILKTNIDFYNIYKVKQEIRATVREAIKKNLEVLETKSTNSRSTEKSLVTPDKNVGALIFQLKDNTSLQLRDC